jgi:hypothetical protein
MAAALLPGVEQTAVDIVSHVPDIDTDGRRVERSTGRTGEGRGRWAHPLPDDATSGPGGSRACGERSHAEPLVSVSHRNDDCEGSVAFLETKSPQNGHLEAQSRQRRDRGTAARTRRRRGSRAQPRAYRAARRRLTHPPSGAHLPCACGGSAPLH